MKPEKMIAVRNNKTVYRDGDKCIKVFNSDYSKADVLNEALNQARIEQTGLRVPKILEVTVIDGKWSIVSEYIKGKTLAQLMEEKPGKKKDYINMLADLQVAMHALRCPLLTKLKDKLDMKISQSEFDATTRYDLHMRLDSMPNHKKVCHGDFNPSNIIINERDRAYIIDWAHASQGNGAADAARTYLLFWLNGDIEGAKQYLHAYCTRSNTARQYVQKWLPIVAAAQSVNGNEAEREFLREWVDVIDYQ